MEIKNGYRVVVKDEVVDEDVRRSADIVCTLYTHCEELLFGV